MYIEKVLDIINYGRLILKNNTLSTKDTYNAITKYVHINGKVYAHLRPSFCTYRHVSPNSLKKQRYLHWLLKTPWLANEDAFMRC